jgi:hypothetical protein
MLLCNIYEELTDIVCVSDVGFCAWADVNALVIMASRGQAFARLLAI